MSIINLLPDDYQELQMKRRITRIGLTMLGVVMSAIMCAYVVSERSSANTREVLVEVEASYANAVKLIDKMHSLQLQHTQLVKKAQSTSDLLERVPRSYILGVISNSCPPQTSISLIRMETRRGESSKSNKFKALASSRAGGGPGTIELWITGHAGTDVDVARFIANLAKSELMSQVDLIYSEQKVYRDLNVREFQVRLELQPDAEIEATDKSGGLPKGGRA